MNTPFPGSSLLVTAGESELHDPIPQLACDEAAYLRSISPLRPPSLLHLCTTPGHKLERESAVGAIYYTLPSSILYTSASIVYLSYTSTTCRDTSFNMHLPFGSSTTQCHRLYCIHPASFLPSVLHLHRTSRHEL